MGETNWKMTAAAVGLALVSAVGLGLMTRKPPPDVGPGPVQAVSYPRVGVFGWMRSTGAPYVKPGGTVDTVACRFLGRHDVAIVDPARTGAPLEALKLVRSYNAKATLLAYGDVGRFFVCAWGWYGQTPPPYGCSPYTLPWAVYRAVDTTGAVLFNTSGAPFVGWSSGPVNIDYTQPGVAKAVRETLNAWVDPGVFNGKFRDEACQSIGWMQKATERIDTRGVPWAEWDKAFRAGVLEALKADGGVIVGNCGPTGPTSLNGWMGENFPHQPPAHDGMTFAQKWTAWDSLLTWADTAYADPTLQFINTARDGRAWVDGTLQRDLRLGLATATLHRNVVHLLVGSPGDTQRGYLPDQWADEYSVNPKGQASGDDRFKGWLGAPERVIRGVGWAIAYFSGGAVVVNYSDAPLSLCVGEGHYRIAGTNSTNNGQAAAHVTVPARDGLFLVRR